MLLIGSCLLDHFTVGILPDDTASILPSFKDITLICEIVEVIRSPPPLPVFSVLVKASHWGGVPPLNQPPHVCFDNIH